MAARAGEAGRFALKERSIILQILPQKPQAREGVGDYALRLAQQLQTHCGVETKFAAPPLAANQCADYAGIVLHYVNYGYHSRGIPKELPEQVRKLKATTRGRLLTIFHELYASGPPWESAFWLQPRQKSIAREIARASDASIVSSETMRAMLRRLASAAGILVHPVISTLGEPTLSTSQLVRRNPHRWVIFGGTELLQRSLRTFSERFTRIRKDVSPEELYLLGGNENPKIRRACDALRSVHCHYRPMIEADAASEILSSCSFAWIDYFRQRGVPNDVILKSGSFASYCAHGVVPVFAARGSAINVEGDQMPGPFFVTAGDSSLPSPAEREKVSAAIYEWYQRHAAVEHLARSIKEFLQLKS